MAPTALTPRTATPGVGALALNGFAPSVLTPVVVTPDAGALVLEGFAPTVSATQNYLAEQSLGVGSNLRLRLLEERVKVF